MTRLGRVVLSLVLALGGLPAGTSTLGRSDAEIGPAPSPLARQEVFGFLPYWELPRASSIDFEALTTLAWFGVEADRDGRLVRDDADGEPTPGWAGWTSEAFTAVREQARAADVRVVLTVERFSWTTAGKRTTKRLLRDPDARRTLAAAIAEAVVEADAGGVNLDFEPLPQSVRGEFVRLVRQVRRALDAVDPSLQLTFDLTPDVESFPLAKLVADGAAHAAVLMGYEYRTAGSKVAGSVAPLRVKDGLDVRESVKLALEKAPGRAVILAMPWYGRAWSTRTAAPDARTRRSAQYLDPSTAVYRDSVRRSATAARQWDGMQGSAWSAYRSRACGSCPLSWRQLWYDDVDSVRAKVGLARRRGLRGVGIWALGYEGERPELWSALRYGLERPSDEEPPVGTAEIDAASVLAEHDGVPVVGEKVTLALEGSDDGDGSGLAFVRVSTRAQSMGDGALERGTTFPAVASVTVMLPGAKPADEVFIPGGVDAPPTPSPRPSPPLASELQPVTIRVQWRDVAGNWSEPVSLKALLGPGT